MSGSERDRPADFLQLWANPKNIVTAFPSCSRALTHSPGDSPAQPSTPQGQAEASRGQNLSRPSARFRGQPSPVTRHFGEVVGEPQTQDSFVTVKTDSHVAKADEHVPQPERTNPGCNTLPPVGTSGPSGLPGPCWHPDKTEEEGGNTATARDSPEGVRPLVTQVGHWSDVM